MAKKLDDLATELKQTAAKAAEDAADFIARDDTQQTIKSVKQTASEAYDDAAEVINRANKFGLGKDVLPFALIGAAVAIPIPFVGPFIGGAIGAAIGAWRGTQRTEAAPEASAGAIEATPTSVRSKPKARNQDVVAELIRFGELRDKGLITQAEFEAQKARLLGEG
ncbi:MAG TPA: SHOCT domain-containing protein [Polymorphobacter sp.]|jgi:membrane protease subunit (stomatin/prohibitin family)|nr:SHOCT domain-containing protein [Polymorphobacter sp.]